MKQLLKHIEVSANINDFLSHWDDGSGKSSVGKRLAKKLQFSNIDIDKEIEKDEKLSIKEIFEVKGENYFREIENKYLLRKENWL